MPNLLFLDLETTGLDTDTCEVIEMAYQIDNYKFTDLYKPLKPIPFEISGITNIDNIDVSERCSFTSSINYFDYHELSTLAESYIAVAHNTDFDLAVLANHGINFEKSICTHKLAWKLLPDLPNHKLGTLRAYFGIPHGGGTAHRAEYDVEILIKVYEKLAEIAIPEDMTGLSHADNYEYLIKLSDQAKLEYLNLWHFGKHKGEVISPSVHRSYINWTLENNKDLAKNFRQHLTSLIS